ncbi:reverse transcriptase domain-containing protein [Tanacetum coccineum]
MNHPCDGRAWKYFDMMKPEFSGDAKNVRLGLAADGFNPFGMMSQTYSMWPVILTTYNTPPWMCMKETSLMLTMLIPGPKSPAKDIDVYLQPLIKELQELWKGVWTKDAATGTHFQMKAALLWTMNDFHSLSICLELYADISAILLMGLDAKLGASKEMTLMISIQDMSEAKKQSISILIELEQIFPPAFFDIMIHVAIHLPDEAILDGPIHYRWMFPFERYMKKLKNYVRNKAKPEGSIAEGYVAEEALTFCSRYLKDDVETRFNRLGRNDDGLPEEEPNKFQVFRSACKLTGRMKATRLTTDVRQAVVWFVLNNSPEVDADILAYKESCEVCGNELRYNSYQLNAASFNTGLDGEMYMDNSKNTGAHLYANRKLSVSKQCLKMMSCTSPFDDDEDVMACVFPRSHGGDAGGSPPRRPNRPVPAQCESSNLRIETGNASLRRAFRQNDQRPLTIGFDYGDLGTFHPTGDYASMLNSLMGETVRYLPLARLEEISEQYCAYFPTLRRGPQAFNAISRDELDRILSTTNKRPICLNEANAEAQHRLIRCIEG